MSGDDFNPNSIDATLARIIARLDEMEVTSEKYRKYVWETLEELKKEHQKRIGASAVWAGIVAFVISIGTVVIEQLRK